MNRIPFYYSTMKTLKEKVVLMVFFLKKLYNPT